MNTKTILLCETIKMNGHSVVFGQLVQKLGYFWVLENRIQQGKGKH